MYPNAKFIHIHRDPYEVFNSNIHLYHKTIRTQFLQEFSDKEIEERVLYCYETSMAKFMEDWKDIPKENAIEISYKELSDSPLASIEKIYKEIHLGNFLEVKPDLEKYISKEKNYKKNSFTEIRSDLLVQINKRWKFVFDKYDYKITNTDS
jgi:hypothetical protein